MDIEELCMFAFMWTALNFQAEIYNVALFSQHISVFYRWHYPSLLAYTSSMTRTKAYLEQPLLGEFCWKRVSHGYSFYTLFWSLISEKLHVACYCRFGALVVGWICGSFLVPLIPSFLLQPTWTLELLTSLVAYVFLFLAGTFLKWDET